MAKSKRQLEWEAFKKENHYRRSKDGPTCLVCDYGCAKGNNTRGYCARFGKFSTVGRNTVCDLFV
jgi:hypothetical protein